MISKEEVTRLAELARLSISPEEVETLQKDISNILSYVGQVNTIAITERKGGDIFPQNIMRPDEVYGPNSPVAGKRDALLAALPEREGDYAVVRKIITKDE